MNCHEYFIVLEIALTNDTTLHGTVLHCTMLHCTVLHCIVLYCTTDVLLPSALQLYGLHCINCTVVYRIVVTTTGCLASIMYDHVACLSIPLHCSVMHGMYNYFPIKWGTM